MKIFNSWLWAFSILAMLTLGCAEKTGEDGACGGDYLKWEATISKTSPFNNYVSGDQRFFVFEDLLTPENICTEEHVEVVYEVDRCCYEDSVEIKISGKAYWGLYASEKPLRCLQTHVGDELECYVSDNIGLKQAFPDEPGWIGLQLLVQFPTRGSYEADYNYMFLKIYSLGITLQYSEHK
ncbi:MAG: hypothetical protein IPO72_11470 [Saprospiraceae bacterium]|nr:hypothetical protein [Candidatus Vicinibacter affinis]